MKHHVSHLTAIFFAILGFTCWVLADSSVKWLSQFGLPADQIIASMGLFMAITLALQAALRRQLDSLRPRSLLRQSLRALLDMANNICVVIALRHLTLSLLSAAVLGERITRRKALALILGFSGVVVAVEPWSHVQHLDATGMAACAVCVACFTVNMVWSRVLTRTEPPESLAFCSGILTAVAGFASASFHFHALTPSLWMIIVMMGIFSAIGTLSFYIAVKHTTAGNVSQYHYTQLITGSLVSYIVWHDRPNFALLAGGVLIAASGLWIALEARKQTHI